LSRHYVLGSWANADEFDYSGEQLMGSRQGKSICMDHMLPSGMANLKRYGDPVVKPKTPTKTKSVLSSILLADRNYERLCSLSQQLDDELDAGHIPDFESYCAARKNIDKRLAAGWRRVCKERNWNESGESLDNSLDSGLSFSLEDIQEARDIGEKQRVKRELTGNEVFDSLSETNSFLRLFIMYKKCVKFIKVLF